MTQGSKGLEVKNYLMCIDGSSCVGIPSGEHVFVDDAPENINDMKTMNPEIKSIRIERVTLSPEELVIVTQQPDLVVPSLSMLSELLFA
jgi:hypothetical protein